MKILVVHRFLLIVAILSSAIAQQEIPQAVPRGTSGFSMLNFANTTFEDIEKFDKELCETHGGPTAYDNHKKSRERYEQCQASVQQEMIRAVMTRNGSRLHNRDYMYYTEYCRRVTSIENCVKNLTESMKSCLDTEKHESANIIYNTISSVLQFVCDDNVARIMKNGTNSIDECMFSKLKALEDCGNQTVIKYINTAISNGVRVGGLRTLHLLTPDVNKCTVLEKFELCTVEVLKNCTMSTTADLAISVFHVVKKATTCDHLLKSQASPASVINIALITAVTAMSLRFADK